MLTAEQSSKPVSSLTHPQLVSHPTLLIAPGNVLSFPIFILLLKSLRQPKSTPLSMQLVLHATWTPTDSFNLEEVLYFWANCPQHSSGPCYELPDSAASLCRLLSSQLGVYCLSWGIFLWDLHCQGKYRMPSYIWISDKQHYFSICVCRAMFQFIQGRGFQLQSCHLTFTEFPGKLENIFMQY